jgi:hypothetical protein
MIGESYLWQLSSRANRCYRIDDYGRRQAFRAEYGAKSLLDFFSCICRDADATKGFGPGYDIEPG